MTKILTDRLTVVQPWSMEMVDHGLILTSDALIPKSHPLSYMYMYIQFSLACIVLTCFQFLSAIS